MSTATEVSISLSIQAPLFTAWSTQYVLLPLPALTSRGAFLLEVDGEPCSFQFEPEGDEAAIWVRLGFDADERKQLILREVPASTLGAVPYRQEVEILPLNEETPLPIGDREDVLRVGATAPFLGTVTRSMECRIECPDTLRGSQLTCTADGPLFTDYVLRYDYGPYQFYTIRFRCYKLEDYVEVKEQFSLGLGARLIWTLNPERSFTHIVSRDSFTGETQPTVEALGVEHPRDVLCRLQMPVQSEYFIPNNRGWFSFYDERNQDAGMWGILGLYGAKWEEPVENMPVLYDQEGRVEWTASLCSGTRHWLMYQGPVEKDFRVQGIGVSGQQTDRGCLIPDPRFVFHRLHAEFNALRLDEHLDLSGEGDFDESCKQSPGVFALGDYHAAAQQRLQEHPCLQEVLPTPDAWLQANGEMHLANYRYLLEPTPVHAEAVYDFLIARFEKWVEQFQGYRTGESDYMKNVIGFSRYLRGMLLGYEMLRRDEVLTVAQTGRLNDYFTFAARRILDEGRWPHSRTWMHPDHPESSRDFYTYGGEHKPDRLVWSNSLPNFQSDPMCVLAHLSAIFKDHPDAEFWRRFALDDIDRQLDAYCGKSGAWQESITYALYSLSYFVITLKAVKERWGIDYFQDERLRRFVGWLCRFAGPIDKRFGVHTMPGVGNAVLPLLGADVILCFASELSEEDPLRDECLRLWEKGKSYMVPSEHYPVVLAAMAPLGDELHIPLPTEISLQSECMDEVGVALRDQQGREKETYLFQKIGFAKDHYEQDETAFNWYAKGTPLCMDYGTYSSMVATGAAHNLVEIPDADSLRRGYLADHLFTPQFDYTRCEVPVTLKLLWGRVRTFEEIDNKDGKINRNDTPYFYIGDPNPLGPKVWKVRQLLLVKSDYTVLFDRVYGRIPHRYNLHVTGDEIQREGELLKSSGRFDLDLLACVQHPRDFRIETGRLSPPVRAKHGGEEIAEQQSQNFVRLYNESDGMYRTLLFAREKGREVSVKSVGLYGFQVKTPDYVDVIFIHNDFIEDEVGDIRFAGRVGWIRMTPDGNTQAYMVDGERFEIGDLCLEGKGPWKYDQQASPCLVSLGGTPRSLQMKTNSQQENL